MWAGLIILFVVGWRLLAAEPKARTVSFHAFRTDVEEGRVQDVKIHLKKKLYTYTIKTGSGDSQQRKTIGPVDDKLRLELEEAGVRLSYEGGGDDPFWTSMLVTWLPILVLVGLFIFFMRQLQAGSGRAMSFGKSRARMVTNRGNKTTFNDVAGIDEVLDELEEIIAFLKDPKRFQRLGGRIPKGVLLMGAPGTGKTLLARAIAGEAEVPFFSISGSDFVEMFVGVGASRVRDLFEQGKKNAPCIIFIDEIDAVGRQRGAGIGGGHDEREQTLNQLLVEMDGFESNDGVIIIAATNRPDVLDPAILRAGRFDRRVIVPLPDIKGRLAILKLHAKRSPLAEDVNLEIIAKGVPGFSGADLENLINEAALIGAREDLESVRQQDYDRARDKVLMGTERKSLVISENEKRTTAYHEAGHTLVAYHLPNADPVHKVTIIPRGQAMGVTQQLPEEDRYFLSKTFAEAKIAVMLAGRAAEEICLGQKTTGAGKDLEQATEIARKMVTQWGMSDELGPLAYGPREEAIFIGREIAQHKEYSEHTAILIDKEVHRFVMEGQDTAMRVLGEHRDEIVKVAEALLEFESLELSDIKRILKGETLPARPQDDAPALQSPTEDGEKEAEAPILTPTPEKA
ncbi:MAG: ATP-dependent zinc metalloprotease FtsH [Deltaproteobacteria bacterium]|nr:ATP-dependent zinc metalloprotease FtsH [Deltaproteobacteria bacterium]